MGLTSYSPRDHQPRLRASGAALPTSMTSCGAELIGARFAVWLSASALPFATTRWHLLSCWPPIFLPFSLMIFVLAFSHRCHCLHHQMRCHLHRSGFLPLACGHGLAFWHLLLPLWHHLIHHHQTRQVFWPVFLQPFCVLVCRQICSFSRPHHHLGWRDRPSRLVLDHRWLWMVRSGRTHRVHFRRHHFWQHAAHDRGHVPLSLALHHHHC